VASALFFAAHNDLVVAARLLIEAGADKNQANTDGATPLFIASQNGHFEVVSVLE
jgi:ankyrin repeat protein